MQNLTRILSQAVDLDNPFGYVIYTTSSCLDVILQSVNSEGEASKQACGKYITEHYEAQKG